MTNNFSQSLFAALVRMDEEAVPNRDGLPTGLNWYGGHFRPELRRPQTEPSWTKRLARLLSEAGFQAQPETPYPASPRKKCDLKVLIEPGKTIWLEIKGAWKEYWRQAGNDSIYRSYLLHPLIEGLPQKSHTAPFDLQKLAMLTREDGDRIGLLLVGFDTLEHPMDQDVSELIRLAGLDDHRWSMESHEWCSTTRPPDHIHCWLWTKKLGHDH